MSFLLRFLSCTFNSTSEDTLLISDNFLTKDNMSAGLIAHSNTPVINWSQAAIIAIHMPRFKYQLHTQVFQKSRAIWQLGLAQGDKSEHR